jgi:hypothetical protein
LFGKSEGKRPLRRPRRRREDNIRMHPGEIVREVVDWMHLAQERPLTGSRKNGNEISGFIKCRKFLDYVSDYQDPTKEFASWS